MTVKFKLANLLKLADEIKDKQLRKKVKDTLKDPGMSHGELSKKYKPCDLKEAPASIQFHHTYDSGLVEHTYAVTKMSMSVSETLESVYGMDIDRDSLIAAALLHDIGKLWGMKKGSAGWGPTGLTLDHTMAGTSELYAREFPEKVLHIVASHFGENGPTPPQTIEALIFHTIDNMDAVIGTNRQENLINLLLKQQ
ncbi:MAG: dihydroneopterin 2',3'-cyclic phosphate phosphodiesterase [Candidatus Aenigmatarchaeota archaeon]|nr:MAG: dihydroneopterin 2',3'-cyclic phosphate phosphodiesterase [Candidatus Aenigmarchaeota archaeon]